MTDIDYTAPWYHGSPDRLDVLRAGSWVTQFKEMAKAFSHRPTLMSLDDDCAAVKHDGKRPGFLYTLPPPIGPDDVSELPGTARTHWQTQREIPLTLIAELPVSDPPQLTPEEIAALRKDIPEGGTGFVTKPG